jgi:hypothetical protein
MFVPIYVFPEMKLCGLLIPKQNYNVLSVLYNRSQIHECKNWDRGRAYSFLGTQKSDFRYSVQYSVSTKCML